MKMGGWKESELCENVSVMQKKKKKRGWDGICSESQSQGTGTAVRVFGFSLHRKETHKKKYLCHFEKYYI